MSNYTVTTNFGAKDSLPSGNAAKVIKGSEFTTEFTNIQTAIATKADTAGDTFTGAVTFDAAVTLNADVTFDTNTLFVDVSANRVGIGNVAPATALDVTGVITTDGLTSSAGIDVTGTVTASSLTVDTDTLYVDATNDRVGIGTTSPATALDVTGTITGDGLTISSATANVADLRRANNTGAGQVLLGNSDGYVRLSGTNGSFDIFNSGNTAQRFGIANNGDISFYEDTGATAKLFWDASAESLGIGTTSPSYKLSIEQADPTLQLKTTNTTGTNTILFSDSASNFVGNIKYNHSDNSLSFATTSTSNERMRIDSSGNVGIGTTNPAESLHTAGNIRLGDTSPAELYTNSNELRLGVDKNNDNVTSNITFYTNNDEKIRIDKDGNLLVGKTSATATDLGCQIENDGQIKTTSNQQSALTLNRKTDDGSIAIFQKDGSPVGSIGVESNGRPYFANSVSDGLKISNDSVAPCNGTGGNADNAIDLGYSSNRWKDLYLSGGVYLGGTGSANKLDDYEEGTWTMSVSDSASTPNVSSTTNANCQYVKVGNQVTIQGYLIDINKGSLGSSALRITGLPFTIKTTGTTRPHGAIQVNNITGEQVDRGLFVQGQANSTYTLIKSNGTGVGATTLNAAALDSGNTADIFFSLTYITN